MAAAHSCSRERFWGGNAMASAKGRHSLTCCAMPYDGYWYQGHESQGCCCIYPFRVKYDPEYSLASCGILSSMLTPFLFLFVATHLCTTQDLQMAAVSAAAGDADPQRVQQAFILMSASLDR